VRRKFGRRGVCRTARVDCWTQDGKQANCEVFIDVPVDEHTVSGRNRWLTIRAKER
jgi:hypothetical protein